MKEGNFTTPPHIQELIDEWNATLGKIGEARDAMKPLEKEEVRLRTKIELAWIEYFTERRKNERTV